MTTLIPTNTIREKYEKITAGGRDVDTLREIQKLLGSKTFAMFQSNIHLNYIVYQCESLIAYYPDDPEQAPKLIFSMMDKAFRDLLVNYQAAYLEIIKEEKRSEQITSEAEMIEYVESVYQTHWHDSTEAIFEVTAGDAVKAFSEWIWKKYPKMTFEKRYIGYGIILDLEQIVKDVMKYALPMAIELWAKPEFDRILDEIAETESEEENA